MCECRDMKFICKSPLAETATIAGQSPRHAAERYATDNCLDDTTIEVLPIMDGHGLGGQVTYTYAVYARRTIVYDLSQLSRTVAE